MNERKMPKLTQREKNKIITSDMFFPKIRDCWEETEHNRKMFMKKLRCEEMSRHHTDPQGCLRIDHAIEKFTDSLGISSDDSSKFFCFYKVTTSINLPRYSPNRLATEKEMFDINKFYFINKMKEMELLELGKPKPKYYDDLPDSVGIKQLFSRKKLDNITSREMSIMKDALGRCIEKRIHYRRNCVIQCSRKVKGQKNHDEFIFILQILRANIYSQLLLRHIPEGY